MEDLHIDMNALRDGDDDDDDDRDENEMNPFRAALDLGPRRPRGPRGAAAALLPRARARAIRNDNNNGDGDDDDLPIAVELPRNMHHRRHRFARAAVLEDGASNVLYSLLCEGVHCNDDLLAPGGCQTIVERCRDHPNEVNFVDRNTGRTPMHEAALRCSCIHIVRALVQAEHEVFQFDRLANTPLHLLFTGIASRQLGPERVHPVLDELLTAGSAVMVNSTNLEGYTPLHV